jgi:hypothetical protein
LVFTRRLNAIWSILLSSINNSLIFSMIKNMSGYVLGNYEPSYIAADLFDPLASHTLILLFIEVM